MHVLFLQASFARIISMKFVTEKMACGESVKFGSQGSLDNCSVKWLGYVNVLIIQYDLTK